MKDETSEGSGNVSPENCQHLNKVADPKVDPTCQQTGLTVGMHCATCGTVTLAQRVIPKIDHKEVANEDVLPGCETVGYTGGTHCEMCKMQIED